ncbi:MAG: riboflavin synthase [Gemmatimonadetes bacterium]|nr:riboflavin synthase [Gemmatimonadota bacterium]
MFSGIVEGTGTVVGVASVENGRRIRLRAPEIVDGLRVGASIAVDGVCLTAVEVLSDGFSADVISTTLARTIAGRYAEGTRVNLERALRLGDRLDGHLVQGHVDGVGAVLAVVDEGETRLVDLRLTDAVDVVTILHGSITVNGVSLTVNALPGAGRCQVALIPHTRAVTTLGDLRTGDVVNLEGDLIGKYVGRIVASRPPHPDPTP